jgi:hypothetical protein
MFDLILLKINRLVVSVILLQYVVVFARKFE